MQVSGWTYKGFGVPASWWLCCCLACTPKKADAASSTGITRNHSSRFPLRGEGGALLDCSTLFITSSSCFITSSHVLSFSVADNREYAGHEEESRDSCKQQAADDRAAERGVLLSALAQPDRHRNHSDNHPQRRHDYRSQSCIPSLEADTHSIFGFGETFIGKADDQYRIRRRDAHA